MKTAELPPETGSGSFVYTEPEFIAAYRGTRIAQSESYDSFITRLGVIVGGHVMLMSGILTLPIQSRTPLRQSLRKIEGRKTEIVRVLNAVQPPASPG